MSRSRCLRISSSVFFSSARAALARPSTADRATTNRVRVMAASPGSKCQSVLCDPVNENTPRRASFPPGTTVLVLLSVEKEELARKEKSTGSPRPPGPTAPTAVTVPRKPQHPSPCPLPEAGRGRGFCVSPPLGFGEGDGGRGKVLSALLELGDAVDALLEVVGRIVGEAVLHQEGVLATVLVVAAEDAD